MVNLLSRESPGQRVSMKSLSTTGGEAWGCSSWLHWLMDEGRLSLEWVTPFHGLDGPWTWWGVSWVLVSMYLLLSSAWRCNIVLYLLWLCLPGSEDSNFEFRATINSFSPKVPSWGVLSQHPEGTDFMSLPAKPSHPERLQNTLNNVKVVLLTVVFILAQLDLLRKNSNLCLWNSMETGFGRHSWKAIVLHNKQGPNNQVSFYSSLLPATHGLLSCSLTSSLPPSLMSSLLFFLSFVINSVSLYPRL